MRAAFRFGTRFILFLQILGAASADESWRTVAGSPEISIERYGLPGPTEKDALLADLASRTGIAGTRLEGLRIRIALPSEFRFESLSAEMVDGLFLEPEHSFLGAMGSFLMRLARLLLFGQLVGVSDGLEIPPSLWFVLLEGDPTQKESVTVEPKRAMEIKSGDQRVSNHGEFVICRLIAATTPFAELISIEIRGRNPMNGERLRYLIPRFVIPTTVTQFKGESSDALAQLALASSAQSSACVGP